MKGSLHRFPAPADPATMSDEQAAVYAGTQLGIAARMNAAENELWAAVEALARAGNSGLVCRLANLHRTTAPADILALLKRGAV